MSINVFNGYAKKVRNPISKEALETERRELTEFYKKIVSAAAQKKPNEAWSTKENEANIALLALESPTGIYSMFDMPEDVAAWRSKFLERAKEKIEKTSTVEPEAKDKLALALS
jgi:hypothetical protein